MAFPTSPINGATATVNGIGYVYSSSTNSWTRAVSPIGNLTVTGNVFTNKLYTTEGLYWAGNGVAFTSGTGGGGGGGLNITTDTVPPGSPSVGDQWYDTGAGILFEYLDDGDSQQWVDISSSSIAANSVVNLSSGDFAILGHITPGLNSVYDLGNVSYQWRNLYVGTQAVLANTSSTDGYFWSNGAPAFYSNLWVAQYLPAHTGNITAGNANIAGTITTTSGLFWSNGAPYTAGRQATSYSMNMIFGI